MDFLEFLNFNYILGNNLHVYYYFISYLLIKKIGIINNRLVNMKKYNYMTYIFLMHSIRQSK